MSVIQIKNTSFFQPTAIAGCKMWLDGADPVGNGTIPANGASVSSWVDKSTNGLTVSAASSQPTYVTNALNGLGTLAFNGSQSLSAASVTGEKLLGGTGSSATFCVFSVTNNTQNSCPITWDDSNYTYRYMITWAGGEGSPGLTFDLGLTPYRTQVNSSSFNFVNNTYYLVSFWRNGATTILNINGITYTLVYPHGTFAGNWSTSASRTLNVGAYVNSSGYNMKGNTAEIIAYNTHIPSNFQQIEGYLAWKWGLQGSLPSTHPFARTPSFATSFYFPRAIPKVIGTTVKNPVLMEGIQLWLDAADTSSMTLSSGAVTQWRDKSSIGNHFTQATNSNAPTLGTSANGLSTMYFATTNQQLTSSQNSATPGNASRTLIQVIWVPTTSSAWYTVTGTESLGTPPPAYGIAKNPNADIDYPFVYSSSGMDIYTFVYSTPTPIIVYTQYDSSSSVLSGYYATGATTTGGFVTKSTTMNTTAGVWYLGRRQQAATGSVTSHLFEMIQYNRVLSTSERQEIEGYLAWKWGIQSLLPSGHPYKSAGPAIVPYVVPLVRSITTIGSPVRIITTGLVSRWQLNESSGSTVIDSVGGNNITIGDSPSRVSVTYGSYTGFALSLQTTSQVGSISLPSNLNVVAHSMTSWVYLTALRPSGQQRWLSWGNGSCGGGGEDFVCYLASSLYHGPSCIVAYEFLSSGVTTGVWYFCVSTYNGTTWTTYLNGTQIQSANAGFGAVNGFFSIGYNRDSAQTLGGNGGGGYLGEIRFYNRALTAEEVLRIYQGTG